MPLKGFAKASGPDLGGRPTLRYVFLIAPHCYFSESNLTSEPRYHRLAHKLISRPANYILSDRKLWGKGIGLRKIRVGAGTGFYGDTIWPAIQSLKEGE